ncbi:hypothetical protein [Saccharopolyspora hattusasensis]|uniref:hypothetical protein n=1 Tax=Saccharopolyspora hattusasensis TaxID=1128679 RepID=UPI003D99ED45
MRPEVESRPEKRAFTIDELQDFSDAPIAYSFGLRRNESRMFEVTDIGRNPHGPEFGDYGLIHVRHGKAKGSPSKRRSVATVWTWTAEILEE